MGHVNLTTSDKEYWDFDFEEMGLYDVPSFINFIKEKTGQKKVTYVGHSEGTTQMFVGTSLIPEFYESKVDLFVALAPVVRLDTVQNAAMQIASKIPSSFLEGLIRTTHMYNVLPRNPISAGYADFCKAVPALCKAIQGGIAGMNNTVDNVDRYPDRVAHAPSGTGWRCLVHYAQIINSHKF